jgi:hypothetical protein
MAGFKGKKTLNKVKMAGFKDKKTFDKDKKTFRRVFLHGKRCFSLLKTSSESVQRVFLTLLTSFSIRRRAFLRQTSVVWSVPFFGLPITKRFFSSSNRD